MKHVHAELIKQLADNTSLVKLVYLDVTKEWADSQLTKEQLFVFDETKRYVLTTQKLEVETLAFLNQKEIVFKSRDLWVPYKGELPLDPSLEWRVIEKPILKHLSIGSFRALVHMFDSGTPIYAFGERVQDYISLAQAYDACELQEVV